MSSTQAGKFDPSLVVLSFGVSFLGAYMAISICEQLRQSLIDDKAIFGKQISISHRKQHLLYLFFMALSIGGIGIWAMHFIGMHAFRLHDIDGHHVHVRYNVGVSIASFITVVFTTFVGVTVASYDSMFSKTKVDIVEEFIYESRKLTFAEIRRISSQRILMTISTKELGYLLIGGFITGSGVSIMHYIGMDGTIFNGEIHWHPGLVTLSVVIAIVASSAAFWIFFRLLSIFPDMELLRIGSAVIMATAVCGMHYTGMVAGAYRIHEHYIVFSSAKERAESMNDADSFFGALLGANFMLWAMVLYALWNSRLTINRQSKLIRQADAVLQKITDEKPPSTIISSSAIIGGSSQSTNNVGQSNPLIRSMAEAYISKRFRGFRKRILSSQESSIVLERQQQASMGFFEYLVHITLLAATCHWQKVWLAMRFDGDTSSLGNGSHHSNPSNHGGGMVDEDMSFPPLKELDEESRSIALNQSAKGGGGGVMTSALPSLSSSSVHNGSSRKVVPSYRAIVATDEEAAIPSAAETVPSPPLIHEDPELYHVEAL